MIASVVVLGLGESKLIGLVTTEGFTSGIHAAFQNNRAEQKAPRDLNSSTQSLNVRETLGGNPRVAVDVPRPRPERVLALPWFCSLCLPFHSYESPRAPPPCG
jgi:hypothetical protein